MHVIFSLLNAPFFYDFHSFDIGQFRTSGHSALARTLLFRWVDSQRHFRSAGSSPRGGKGLRKKCPKLTNPRKSTHLNYIEKQRLDWKKFFTLRIGSRNDKNWCSFSLKTKQYFWMDFRPHAGVHISCVFLGSQRQSGKCVNLSEKQRCNSTPISAHEASSLSLRFPVFPVFPVFVQSMETMTQC